MAEKKVETVNEKSFEEIKAENEQYAQKLSKRSEQYIYELKKKLSDHYNVEKQEHVLNELLPKLVEGQRKGETARQQFGTVDECLKLILEGPKVPIKEMPFWQMWLDNSLMVFAILGAMNGIIGLFPQKTMRMGITSMVLSAVCGGVVFWALYHFIYRYDRPGADHSKKPKTWKSVVIITALMLIWMAILQMTMVFLPTSLNPVFSPILTLLVSAAVYGIRTLLKRKLGYKGSFFTRA